MVTLQFIQTFDDKVFVNEHMISLVLLWKTINNPIMTICTF